MTGKKNLVTSRKLENKPENSLKFHTFKPLYPFFHQAKIFQKSVERDFIIS